MQNDKEFLSDLFNAIGQGLSDGLELNDSIKPKRQPQWWGDQSQCMNPQDESGDHHWNFIGWADGEVEVFECSGCHEKRYQDAGENQPWNDDLNPQ